MQQQIQQNSDPLKVKITRAAMEEELGDSYKRCWAYAFKYAVEELDFDKQVESLCREFDLVRHQALWFVNGANSILFKKEVKDARQENQNSNISQKQRELTEFSSHKATGQQDKYVSELEVMSFLEVLEEMGGDSEFSQFWDELSQIRQKVIEQYCATEKEILAVFKIRSLVERAKEETERFFDAYPVSTDAWENGYFSTVEKLFLIKGL
jgi:hypothetical protein